jgi:hypothetical protein
MSSLFLEYCDKRISFSMRESLDDFFFQVAKSGIPTNILAERLIRPVVQEGNYDSPQTLLNELVGRLARWMRGKQPQQPVDANQFDDPSKPQPLSTMPHPDTRGFRPRSDRELSRGDMDQANSDTHQQNLDRDTHNQQLGRSQLDQKEGQHLKQVRDEMHKIAQNSQRIIKQMLSAIQKDVEKSPRAKTHHVDVLRQFVTAINNAVDNFKPQIDLKKYYQQPDYSSVKSGIGAEHVPNPKAPYYTATDPQSGQVTPGRYGVNQRQGDLERKADAARGSAFNNKNRNIRAS